MEFNKDNSIEIEDIKDFITVAYVFIDDIYKHIAADKVKQRRNKDKALLSDSEIITIAVVGEAMGIDSEKAWYNYVKKNMKDLFPLLCERSRCNRLRRDLTGVIERIRVALGSYLPFTGDRHRIIDSHPLPVCKFARATYCRFNGYEADYGYCASKKEHYFGYKVHALCTLQGYITDILVSPASVDDRHGVWELSERYEYPLTIIADKGYIGKLFIEELQNERNITLIPIKKRNDKKPYSKRFRQLLYKLRRRIETSFSQFAFQFNGQRVLAKSLWGLKSRLLSKVLAFNLCFAINLCFDYQDNFASVKHLIF